MVMAIMRPYGSLRSGLRVVAKRNHLSRAMSTTDSYKLLILGAGTAGTTVASKFASKLGKGHLAIIEPSKVGAICRSFKMSIWWSLDAKTFEFKLMLQICEIDLFTY